MPLMREQILLEFIARDRIAHVVDNVRKRVSLMQRDVGGFNEVMGMNFEAWRDVNKNQQTFITAGGVAANRVRMLTHGMRGFRMELLAVMFFGMFIGRMFLGLLQPAMQLSGVLELISTTLSILFLPVSLALLEVLMPILEFFIALPEPVKLVIGIIVLLAGVFLTILGLIGQVMLGIGGLVLFFGTLGISGGTILGILSGVAAFISSVLIPVLAAAATPILILIGVLALLAVAFFNNKENILSAIWELFEIIGDIISDIIKIFRGLILFISGVLTNDVDKAMEGIELIFEGFVGLVTALLWRLPIVLIKILGHLLLGLFAFIVKLPAFAMELGKRIGAAIARGLMNAFNNGIRGLFSFIGNIGRGASGLIGRIPGLQEGGIVTRPTLALVGEAGPEAVIPLDRANGMSPIVNITIHANTTAGVTADDIATLVERSVGNEFRRLNSR